MRGKLLTAILHSKLASYKNSDAAFFVVFYGSFVPTWDEEFCAVSDVNSTTTCLETTCNMCGKGYKDTGTGPTTILIVAICSHARSDKSAALIFLALLFPTSDSRLNFLSTKYRNLTYSLTVQNGFA